MFKIITSMTLTFLIMNSASAQDESLKLLKTEHHNKKYSISNLKSYLSGKTFVEGAMFINSGKKVCNVLNITKDLKFEYMNLEGNITVDEANKQFTLNFSNKDVPARTIKLKDESHVTVMAQSSPYYKGEGASINIINDKPKSLIRVLFHKCEQSHNCRKWCKI